MLYARFVTHTLQQQREKKTVLEFIKKTLFVLPFIFQFIMKIETTTDLDVQFEFSVSFRSQGMSSNIHTSGGTALGERYLEERAQENDRLESLGRNETVQAVPRSEFKGRFQVLSYLDNINDSLPSTKMFGSRGYLSPFQLSFSTSLA